MEIHQEINPRRSFAVQAKRKRRNCRDNHEETLENSATRYSLESFKEREKGGDQEKLK
jgi:hypothetical protein